MKLKNNKGVTITSILIYVIALTIVVIIVGRITTYFYTNINLVTGNTVANAEYTKFNSYFTDEINIEGNKVADCGITEDGNYYIIFSVSGNQYTFLKECIYMNKIKISKDIENCRFEYDINTEVISVYLKILGKEFYNTYTVYK